jgi:hypothetical protein
MDEPGLAKELAEHSIDTLYKLCYHGQGSEMRWDRERIMPVSEVTWPARQRKSQEVSGWMFKR